MLVASLIPAAEATVFTLGCALIQAQRHRAERLTNVLAEIALVLTLAIILLITPVDQLNMATEVTAIADMGN